MRKLLFVCLCFLLISCSKISLNTPIPSYVRLENEQIRELLSTNSSSFTTITLTDEEYVLPTEEWVRGTFTKQFSQFVFDYNVKTYIAGRNECDKASLYGRAVANILNRQNTDGKNAGIAVGETYLLSGIYGHAINFMVVAGTDKKPRLMFFEPQTTKIVYPLTNYNTVVLRWHM